MRLFLFFCPFLFLFLIRTQNGNAHPTGNMIVYKGHLLWSYVYPVDDAQHHACVMIWDKKSEPELFIISEFPASDWMIYASAESLYLIERKYIAEKDEFQFRVLKGNLIEKPGEIWPWTADPWRTGEGGFLMESDQRMVFCSYPGIFRMEKGLEPVPLFKPDQPVKKLRQVPGGNLLLLGDRMCMMTTSSGEILKNWENLLRDNPENPPLGRNMIYDADYREGDLVIAYWGNRSFELFPDQDKRKVLKKFESPWSPHWVAFDGNEIYLFASSIEAGRNPRPQLLKYGEILTEIWVERR